MIEAYEQNYPQVMQYKERIIKDAHEKMFVSTYYGRRRYLRLINAPTQHLQKREERMGFNAVIQGTAADIIKKAMVVIQKNILQEKISAQMVMQVHDELVFYIPEDIAEKTTVKIKEMMIQIEPFDKDFGGQLLYFGLVVKVNPLIDSQSKSSD